MPNYIQIGALTAVGGAILQQVTVKILLAGLYLTGAFFITDPTNAAFDGIVQYDDLDLSGFGFDLTVPTPSEINDVAVKWWIYDETGMEVNSDSYYAPQLLKGTPHFINAETRFKREITELSTLTVKIQVGFKISMFTLNKEKMFKVDVVKLPATTNELKI